MAEETQLAEEGQEGEKLDFDLIPAERAAVILLLLGEEQAAEIISYMLSLIHISEPTRPY